MNKLAIALYSYESGAVIMVGVFSLVIIGLIGAVLLMMNSNNKKD